MPLIQVKVIEGAFSDVVIEEVKNIGWGIGGTPLTTADVKALAASKPPR